MLIRRLVTACAVLLVIWVATSGFAASIPSKHYAKAHRRNVAASTTARSRRHVRRVERFRASSFASGQTIGDNAVGEDPIVRAAAIDALGDMNGTIVAIDPSNGRILAMVNQKLALSGGAQPCSTIKVTIALAALKEGIVTKDTQIQLGRRWQMDMTEALAHSNNLYFETLGRRLGFKTVHSYATEFGLGEMAGWNIAGETLGRFPSVPPPASRGGVGKMCSFGETISMTPLQLGALMSAVANGGTLFYLQHPVSPDQLAAFQPRVKRYLDIRGLIPEISEGMAGAVEYGTARKVRENFIEEPVLGKTGTCSNAGTRFGWFASFANTQSGRIVAVVFLEGGRPTFGPKAAELAGKFYRNLYESKFFAERRISSPGLESRVGLSQ